MSIIGALALTGGSVWVSFVVTDAIFLKKLRKYKTIVDKEIRNSNYKYVKMDSLDEIRYYIKSSLRLLFKPFYYTRKYLSLSSKAMLSSSILKEIIDRKALKGRIVPNINEMDELTKLRNRKLEIGEVTAYAATTIKNRYTESGELIFGTLTKEEISERKGISPYVDQIEPENLILYNGEINKIASNGIVNDEKLTVPSIFDSSSEEIEKLNEALSKVKEFKKREELIKGKYQKSQDNTRILEKVA